MHFGCTVQALAPTADQVCIATDQGTVRCARVVVALGAWSGSVLAAATGVDAWNRALLPRKGHLVHVVPPQGVAAPIHGLMETAYKSVGVVECALCIGFMTMTVYIHMYVEMLSRVSERDNETPGACTCNNTLRFPEGCIPFLVLQARAAEAVQGSASDSTASQVAFTATRDALGHVLLGSSRSFQGFDATSEADVVEVCCMFVVIVVVAD